MLDLAYLVVWHDYVNKDLEFLLRPTCLRIGDRISKNDVNYPKHLDGTSHQTLDMNWVGELGWDDTVHSDLYFSRAN